MQLSLARVFAVFFLILPIVLPAQDRRQYLLGSSGLNSGIRPPTGFRYLNTPGLYASTAAPQIGLALGPQASVIAAKWNPSFLFATDPSLEPPRTSEVPR
jgi:hypothetical protein